MSRLRVHLLGGLSVRTALHGELPLAASCRPVLGYLLTQRHRAVSRTELAEMLWAEHDRKAARHCLATALWRLKQACGGAAPLLRLGSEDEIAFDWHAPHWVDAIALQQRVTPLVQRAPHALDERERARMEHALGLYHGDYLSGLDAEWALLERQRLRSLYCDGLYQLVNACATASQWQRAVAWGRRLSREEPLREDVQRLVMLALAHTGNRALALSLYRECAARLELELGVEPMAETQELARNLAANRPLAPPAAPAAALDHARQRIRRVRRVLAASQRQLDSALHLLEPGGADRSG